MESPIRFNKSKGVWEIKEQGKWVAKRVSLVPVAKLNTNNYVRAHVNQDSIDSIALDIQETKRVGGGIESTGVKKPVIIIGNDLVDGRGRHAASIVVGNEVIPAIAIAGGTKEENILFAYACNLDPDAPRQPTWKDAKETIIQLMVVGHGENRTKEEVYRHFKEAWGKEQVMQWLDDAQSHVNNEAMIAAKRMYVANPTMPLKDIAKANYVSEQALVNAIDEFAGKKKPKQKDKKKNKYSRDLETITKSNSTWRTTFNKVQPTFLNRAELGDPADVVKVWTLLRKELALKERHINMVKDVMHRLNNIAPEPELSKKKAKQVWV